MKKTKFQIWINGHYLETLPSEKAAKTRIAAYERSDRYEIEVEGYKNALPTYEIKTI